MPDRRRWPSPMRPPLEDRICPSLCPLRRMDRPGGRGPRRRRSGMAYVADGRGGAAAATELAQVADDDADLRGSTDVADRGHDDPRGATDDVMRRSEETGSPYPCGSQRVAHP